ncbi:hypothetical protein ACRALDRAFT_210309 [Sodiomyces alcalophilus JCM 7366]|uniref:uncharacterized protein n=1 Tax=Sodiomyces alcalophilus JCM 7366 TaxID=591952 RepID=UPI0039B6A93E
MGFEATTSTIVCRCTAMCTRSLYLSLSRLFDPCDCCNFLSEFCRFYNGRKLHNGQQLLAQLLQQQQQQQH